MGNPATELAALFESWTLERNTPVEARGGANDGDVAFWRAQAYAVSLLQQVDHALGGLALAGEDVSMYDLAPWYRVAFSKDAHWATAGQSGVAIRSEDLNALKSLGLLLKWAKKESALSVQQRSDLLGCVQDAIELLRNDGAGLEADEKAYALTLLESLRSMLDEKAILDESDLRVTIDQLDGALVRIAAQFFALDGDDSRASRVHAVIGRIVRVSQPLIYPLAAVATIVQTAIAIEGATH